MQVESAGPGQPDEETLINEEYKVWKKNAPLLYDTLITRALEWPSLTVQWFPDRHQQDAESDKGLFSTQRLLMGTHTSGGASNSVLIVEVKMPRPDVDYDARSFGKTAEGRDNPVSAAGKFEVVQRINHPTEVNRARYMWQNPNIIATKTATADLLVFDRTRHPSRPDDDSSCHPDLVLKGHKKEGYGLCWSPHQEGRLLSGSDDGLVCMWDIDHGTLGGSIAPGSSVNPVSTFAAHADIVEDVAFHAHNESLFGSCGDDRVWMLWDTRQAVKPTQLVNAHDGEVNSMAFSPFNENLVLSAGADKTVALWDLRDLSRKLHSFEGHQKQILSVEWSPFCDSVFASCSADRRIHVWDMSRIGKKQTPEEEADGPPELLFIHGGHTDRVSDFSWSKNEDWVMASVADNNVVQMWKMGSHIYGSAGNAASMEVDA